MFKQPSPETIFLLEERDFFFLLGFIALSMFGGGLFATTQTRFPATPP